MQPSGRPCQPLDRPGNRHGRHHPAARTPYRRGHRRDPRLAFGHRAGPASVADPGQRRRGELGAAQSPVQDLAILPGQQNLGRGSGRHRQRRAHRHRVPQPARALGRRDADPDVGLAPVELGALPGVIPQPDQHRLGDHQQPVLAGRRGQLGDPGAEYEPARLVPGDQPVVLERDRDPVHGRPRQPRGRHELGQRRGAALHGTQHGNGLV
jgi:hypothetical protein